MRMADAYYTIRVAPSVEAKFCQLLASLKAKLQEPDRLTRHGLARYLFQRGLVNEERGLRIALAVPDELLR